MKLIIAIVQDQDGPRLIEELSKNDFGVTKLASTGGFLREGNTTLIIGAQKEKVHSVIAVIENICKTREIATSFPSMVLSDETFVPYPFEIEVGGATIFILDVERYERI